MCVCACKAAPCICRTKGKSPFAIDPVGDKSNFLNCIVLRFTMNGFRPSRLTFLLDPPDPIHLRNRFTLLRRRHEDPCPLDRAQALRSFRGCVLDRRIFTHSGETRYTRPKMPRSLYEIETQIGRNRPYRRIDSTQNYSPSWWPFSEQIRL